MQSDYWRNFGSWLTERLTVKVEWAKTLIDIRLMFQRQGKWMSKISAWKPVEQNFWNGMFTFQVYVVKTSILRMPLCLPRYGVVVRFAENWWYEEGIGFLFDRGEFGAKAVIMEWSSEEKYNPGCNAKGWEEGPV